MTFIGSPTIPLELHPELIAMWMVYRPESRVSDFYQLLETGFGKWSDDVDFCVDLIKQVGSEHFKLLFDIYHVEIMNGDVIRRIREYKDYIGHYHTAGNPGRGEIDGSQEINYPPIIREIVKTGFTDYVAQEFIPTWEDPFKSLKHGVETCIVK